jgi:hypothetical protein
MNTDTVITIIINIIMEHAIRSWLRNYETSQMVAGSIPDDAIGFFN